jgi:hypothetical protein
MRKHLTPGVVLGVIAICIAMSGSAVAGSLITSAKIKDGTITNKDIKKGTISLNRLTKGTQKAVRLARVAGPQGATGATGAAGAPGTAGAPGKDGADGAPGTTLQPSPGASALRNWGIVNRNTIGSPTMDLRSGPGDPAVGDGSLNINVKDGTEKAAWGNEVDFVNAPFKDITAVGFRVLTTGENQKAGGTSQNMPSITFEANPDIAGKSTYTSLVFMPNNTTPNQWSGYIDATSDSTGFWGGTGNAFAGTDCDINGKRCTFSELKSMLGANAKILSVGITKGRDFAWNGAVDGLRVNDKVYDFEAAGVFAATP